MFSQSTKPLKVFFFAMDGVGHLNACVGMAQALIKRGHRIYFLLNDAYSGQFSKFGFDEILLKTTIKAQPDAALAGVGESKKNPVMELAENLIKSGKLSAKSPLEKLRDQLKDSKAPEFMENMYVAIVEKSPLIADAIKREKPDLFILDHFIVPPAVPLSGIPWLYLFSGNPLQLYASDKLPPFGSGYATDSDPSVVEYRE